MNDDIFIFDETDTILKGVKDKSVKSVDIPNNVTSIGQKVFQDCSGLIPKKLTRAAACIISVAIVMPSLNLHQILYFSAS